MREGAREGLRQGAAGRGSRQGSRIPGRAFCGSRIDAVVARPGRPPRGRARRPGGGAVPNHGPRPARSPGVVSGRRVAPSSREEV
eukprot:1934816-Prymnesium_polylepis.3